VSFWGSGASAAGSASLAQWGQSAPGARWGTVTSPAARRPVEPRETPGVQCRRHRGPRLRVRSDVQLELVRGGAGMASARLVDIGAGGIRLETPAALREADEVRVHVDLGHGVLELPAVIHRASLAHAGMHVAAEFLDAEPETARAFWLALVHSAVDLA
jgi:PilZ domain